MATFFPGTKIGFWLMSSNLNACESAAHLGYDIAILDIEHGVHAARDSDYITCAARAMGLTVYWRVGNWDRLSIQQALDAGADGILVPQIRTLAEARLAVSHAKYPPLGTRGLGHSRLNHYDSFPADFLERQNERTRCIIMIETAEALGQCEAILALPGVDGLFIGPSDLSLTSGRGLNRSAETDLQDYRRVAAAAKAANKQWSISAGGGPRQQLAIDLGAEFFTISDDYSACFAGFGIAAEALAKATGSRNENH